MRNIRRRRSIKAGRTSYLVGGFFGIFFAIIGIGFTFVAISMGLEGFFPFPMTVFPIIFGVVFTLIGITSSIFSFYNANTKNRTSLYDIEETIETDDLGDSINKIEGESIFCPYCGASLQNDFEFCNKCGKKTPN